MIHLKNISCESHLGILAGQDGEHGSVVVVYPVLGRGSLLHSGGHSEAEEGDEEVPLSPPLWKYITCTWAGWKV